MEHTLMTREAEDLVADGAVDASTPREPMSDLPFGLRAMAASLRFFGLAVVDLLMLLWLCVVVVLSCVGIGIPLVNPTLRAVRRNAQRNRQLAYEAAGVPVVATYLPLPEDEGRWGLGAVRRRLADPTIRRDLLWTLVNPVVGLPLGPCPPRSFSTACAGWRWAPLLRLDTTPRGPGVPGSG